MAQFELTLLDWAEENRGSVNMWYLPINAGRPFRKSLALSLCYVNNRPATKGFQLPVKWISTAHSRIYRNLRYREPCNLAGYQQFGARRSVPQEIEGKVNYTMKDTFLGIPWEYPTTV